MGNLLIFLFTQQKIDFTFFTTTTKLKLHTTLQTTWFAILTVGLSISLLPEKI